MLKCRSNIMDIRGRRNAEGQLGVIEVIGKRDSSVCAIQSKSFTYAVVEFKQGKYCVVLVENFVTQSIAEI
jgi:hypothetical protein